MAEEPQKQNFQSLPEIPVRKVMNLIPVIKGPFVLTIKKSTGGLEKLIAFPYHKTMESKAAIIQQQYIKKEVSYDEYRKQLLIQGLEQLQAGLIFVKPGSIIAAENLEEIKKRNKLLATELLMEAAKMWAGRKEWHICPHCGHRMLPESVHKEAEAVVVQEGEEVANGESLPAHT